MVPAYTSQFLQKRQRSPIHPRPDLRRLKEKMVRGKTPGQVTRHGKEVLGAGHSLSVFLFSRHPHTSPLLKPTRCAFITLFPLAGYDPAAPTGSRQSCHSACQLPCTRQAAAYAIVSTRMPRPWTEKLAMCSFPSCGRKEGISAQAS